MVDGLDMEILDIYNDDGSVSGRTVVRGDKLNENEHIALAVIFIQNDVGEFLIQKTSKEKGGEYATTGGHVLSGETPLEAIVREVNEELGIVIDENEIEFIGMMNFDMPFRFIYYLRKNVDVDDTSLQDDEVDFVEYMGIDKIGELIENGAFLRSHEVLFKRLIEIKSKGE